MNACLDGAICTKFFRGGTIRFASTFYDPACEVANPAEAFVRIEYQNQSGVQVVVLQMTPPSGEQTRWTALWDTRGVNPGPIFWSIHSSNPVDGGAVAVEDGTFTLSANVANVLTFS